MSTEPGGTNTGWLKSTNEPTVREETKRDCCTLVLVISDSLKVYHAKVVLQIS